MTEQTPRPAALADSHIPGLTPRRGKVRDVYDFGDRVLIVATDRVSAFDWVLPTAIPDKGRVLTRVSNFWFDRFAAERVVPDHRISDDPAALPLPDGTDVAALAGRSVVAKKATVVPIECVARGYLAGSGWKEYRTDGTVCGLPLPAGLTESARLPEPIFTPATKAEEGHDENIPFATMCGRVGTELSETLRGLTLRLYESARVFAETKGILIADTKFEFGLVDGELLLVDEALTPDSSRFWPADDYRPGRPQPSFDKQYVRDWLAGSDWDKQSPPPPLPDDVVAGTRSRYVEAYERLLGQPFQT
ncbi:MAG: phosphoribosylaminoimidazolesuccinocarboxamide synthase [Planctomycetota bacterium]